jgi:hypothetical protein
MGWRHTAVNHDAAIRPVSEVLIEVDIEGSKGIEAPGGVRCSKSVTGGFRRYGERK